MTNKEALAAKLLVPIPDTSLEVALIDAEVSATTTYDKTQEALVDKALIATLYFIFTNPDIVEGGYRVSNPDFLRKIKERLLLLATKYDDKVVLGLLQEAGPTISSKPVW